MEVALKNFSSMNGEKAVVLGDMFELGDSSKIEHQNIADLAFKLRFNEIYLIGNYFHSIDKENLSNMKTFENREEAINYFSQHPIRSKTLLRSEERRVGNE